MSFFKGLVLKQNFWVRQAIFLLPLCLTLAALKVFIPANSMEAFFAPLRARKDLLYYSMYYTSLVGNFIFYFVYATILVKSIKSGNKTGLRFVLSYIIVQLTITLFTVHFFKIVLGRPRPFSGEMEWQSFNLQDRYHSLPSGHTAEMFGAVSPLAQVIESYGFVFLFGLIPALMGFSRIYLGMHHLGDVLAGAMIGTFSSYCILHLSQRPPLLFLEKLNSLKKLLPELKQKQLKQKQLKTD